MNYATLLAMPTLTQLSILAALYWHRSCLDCSQAPVYDYNIAELVKTLPFPVLVSLHGHPVRKGRWLLQGHPVGLRRSVA